MTTIYSAEVQKIKLPSVNVFFSQTQLQVQPQRTQHHQHPLPRTQPQIQFESYTKQPPQPQPESQNTMIISPAPVSIMSQNQHTFLIPYNHHHLHHHQQQEQQQQQRQQRQVYLNQPPQPAFKYVTQQSPISPIFPMSPIGLTGSPVYTSTSNIPYVTSPSQPSSSSLYRSPPLDHFKISKQPTRQSNAWSYEDDCLLRHLKEVRNLGWREISMYFRNRTSNGCQFRWRRLVSIEKLSKKDESPVSPKTVSSTISTPSTPANDPISPFTPYTPVSFPSSRFSSCAESSPCSSKTNTLKSLLN